MRELTLFLAIAATVSCSGGGGDDGDAGPDGGDADTGDTDTDDAGPTCEEDAAGDVPAAATEMAHEEDGGDTTVLDMLWNPIPSQIGPGTYIIGEEPMWEAVRFDLPAPATVYGARAQWGNLDAVEGERPVRLGAYADFGSNGFDFWQWEALWEGDRCLTPDDQGQWVDYVFDAPLEVDQPGLFYIAHYFPGAEPDEESPHPMWLYMVDPNDCSTYDGCHSAWNLPEADASYFYNGLTYQSRYDYAVRLLVELHDTIPATDKWFQVDDALIASSRVAWGDYDNDGDDDLMTNGPVLYRNEGDGTFTDVTAAAGLFETLIAGSGGGQWGDYDNDGCLDYFGQGTGRDMPDILLHNECDGTFTDATLSSGITDTTDEFDCVEDVDVEYAPTEGAAWVDLDADGFLDLYLAEYECNYAGYQDRVWRNNGDGTFEDWTLGHGFELEAPHCGRGVSPLDHDDDGDMDVFVSNYRLDPNHLFENHGDGTFADIAGLNGLEGHEASSSYGHTIGSTWADLDSDGDLDIVMSNLAHPRFYHFSDLTQVWANLGGGFFDNRTDEAALHFRETHSNPTTADFDNDGDVDLFITCVYEGRFSELYLNDGSGRFDQVNYESGAVVHNGWGSAASDFDNDGDVDLVAYDLFRNDTAAAGNHWLQVRALGGDSSEGPVNAAGIGAVVRVTASGVTTASHVSGGSGTGCQDSAFLTFGLGDATTADSVEVAYPGGAVVTVDGPIDADQRIWVRADGQVGSGWQPPF